MKDLSKAVWTKSSHSGDQNCVEVAHLDGGCIGMRDSKNPDGPALTFTATEWDAFIVGVHDRQFSASD